MSGPVIALLVLLGAPIVLGAVFGLIIVVEAGRDDAGRIPFDPPQSS